jgi:hypothetical protein
MALRRPDAGWHSPLAVVAREASVAAPILIGTQDSVKRCHARSDAGSSAAGSQYPPSTLTSTWLTPPSAQAQPQISIALEALIIASGAGATITDCGAIVQTGTVRPLAGGSCWTLRFVWHAPNAGLTSSLLSPRQRHWASAGFGWCGALLRRQHGEEF